MKTYRSEEIPVFDKRPGMGGTFVHGESLSLTHWTFAKDAVLAEHSHVHEQITYVVRGKIRFDRKDGDPVTVSAGGFAVFAPNEPHGGVALEDTIAIDAFCPVREDFKQAMERK
jgi:Uncharacterized conserved protein, contains double-stranded beta-helix domain